MTGKMELKSSQAAKMLEVLEMKFDGVPIAKGRPRFSMRGKFAKVYTPKKTADAEKNIRDRISIEMCGRKPLDELMRSELEFCCVPPKSWAAYKRIEAIDCAWPHLVKPDLDNLVKLILDAGNNSLWDDDKLIFSCNASKRYSKENATILRVYSF